jgi:type 1 fimbriae regulatory protein FimB/type 1 fimbriae regulatory protein FimE
MISLAHKHGRRVSELIRLRWSAVDFKRADIDIVRSKNGKGGRQPLTGADLRGLRALYRERKSDEWIFMSERGPFTRDGFNKLLAAVAEKVGVPNAHPHSLRHALGHALAMAGRDTKLIQDYLGHRNIQHTARYTEGISSRFKEITAVLEKLGS